MNDFLIQNPWRTNPAYRFQKKSRLLFEELKKTIETPKMIGLLGSRQVGKSSLLFLIIEHLLQEKKVSADHIFYFNCDNFRLHEIFSSVSSFLEFIGTSTDKKYIFIDEIQRLPNPGLFLKELYDLELPLKIFYSGSSQLEIRSKTKEHLVGRTRQIEVQRLSFEEYCQWNAPILKRNALKEYLLYGGYPEIAIAKTIHEKKLALKDIVHLYIQKDIIEFLHVDQPEVFNKLLIILAAQSGMLLNIDSLSKSLKTVRKTIETYIKILEDTFIIRKVFPFSKNYIKEVTKTPKIFFLDTGLRNNILQNFTDPDLRNDKGELFETMVFLDLMAHDPYQVQKILFWRTTNQSEIDFIIHSEHGIEALEVKWSKNILPRVFETFQKYYPQSTQRVITQEDFYK